MVTEGLQVLHAIPGRLRVRVPALKTDLALARRLEAGLALAPGVRHAQVNPQTGGLVVQYDPAQYRSPADLLALARGFPDLAGVDVETLEQQLTMSMNRPASEVPPGQALTAVFASLNERIKTATGGTDLALLLPLALLALGIRSFLVSERTLPTWYDFLWFAFSSYFVLNRESAPRDETGRRE